MILPLGFQFVVMNTRQRLVLPVLSLFVTKNLHLWAKFLLSKNQFSGTYREATYCFAWLGDCLSSFSFCKIFVSLAQLKNNQVFGSSRHTSVAWEARVKWRRRKDSRNTRP